MRINKKRMSDAKSFRLRYLEKRAPKHDSNNFSEMLKDKINKLKIATNRDFDYTTKQNISKILRKLDGGELSTSEKRNVVEMTENMLNKLPKYNNKVIDIIDEIHDLLDDCKLSMNDTNKMKRKHKRDAFISHDVDARVSDWRDVLRIYLEWEGILGYNFIIEEYLEEKDFDGLREYLEDEGIYGYFDDIVDIYETGEVNIPDMDEEDYEKFF